MSRSTRIEAARLAVGAAQSLDETVSSATIFALCIFFESWIEKGGSATQTDMKLLPEDSATILRLVPKASPKG